MIFEYETRISYTESYPKNFKTHRKKLVYKVDENKKLSKTGSVRCIEYLLEKTKNRLLSL